MSLFPRIPPSFFDLKTLVTRKVQSAQADDQIFETVQKLVEKSLSAENIVLSRREKDRLLYGVLKSVLTDMLTKLDSHQTRIQ